MRKILCPLSWKKRFLIGAGAAIVACAAGPLSAQIVSNGSFEDPIVNGIFETVTGGAIDDWIIGGNVDHIGTYWAA